MRQVAMPRRHVLSLAVVAVVLGQGGLAAAQTTVTGGSFRQQTVVDETLNRKGRIEVGLNLAGAMSFGSTTPDGGESTSQSNVYVTPALVGGYMLTDSIELRLSVGGQLISQSVGDAASLTNTGFVGALQALYQRDMILGMALYAGLGGGGFYGWRHAEAGSGLEEKFTNSGGLGQLMLGLLMMPGPRLLLRGGLRADFLFGSESSTQEGTSIPDSSFFTTQILFDVSIGVRFN
jgi:hypothetical protein